MRPDCCVIIPYYDSGDDLVVALDSIDNPSGRVSVLVVDDGSTRLPARSVLQTYRSRVPLELVELPENRGIARALNRGIEEAGGRFRYLARLDAGDRCRGERFRKQLDYLDTHPDVYLLGSWVNQVDLDGTIRYVTRQPATSRSIRRRMPINCVFTHPSVVFRTEVLDVVGVYPTDRPAAEDYALFYSVVKRFETANLAEPLVDCILDPRGISIESRRTQIRSRLLVMRDHYDFSAVATYGVIRALLLWPTPMAFSVFLNRVRAGSMRVLERVHSSARARRRLTL